MSSRAALDVVRRLLSDRDPLVRRAAVAAYDGAPREQSEDLWRMLDDPVADVRIEAARRVAVLSVQGSVPRAEKRDEAIRLYVAAESASLDRPESLHNLGTLLSELGRAADARDAFERSLSIEPSFAPAAINLVDLYRAGGRDEEGEAVLQKLLELAPGMAVAHHAHGLWLARAGRSAEALAELRRANELAPEDPHFGFALAVTLCHAKKLAEARVVLERVLARHPYHRESLGALAEIERETGRFAEAGAAARRLLALEPSDPSVRALLDALGPSN